jgi:hypothetical protein
MNNIARATGALTIQPGSEDPFEITFRAALPVLDAVVEVWNVLRWFTQERDKYFDLEDETRATQILQTVPDEARLSQITSLFREAEFEPAPESWLHVAVGAMLASHPDASSVSDAYRCAIADAAYRDPEIWDGYGPGFSSATIARAIRQARLKGALLAPGDFIKLCLKHRAQFRLWRLDIEALIALRYQARTILGEIGPDDPNWIPF